MSFGVTETITVNAVAKILNRVNQDNYGSEYSLLTATDYWNMKIRHSTDKVDADGFVMLRHNVYIEHKTLLAGVVVSKESFTFTMRGGQYDGTTNEGYLAKAALAWLSASTYAHVDDLGVGLN